MMLARPALAAVSVLALLTACGSGSPATSDSPAATTSPSSTPGPDGPSAPAPTATGPTSLAALQLCATTLGYAAGALSGATAEQLATFQAGVVSSQSKAGPAEAALVVQSQAVLAAGASGDRTEIGATGKKMGELCGAG